MCTAQQYAASILNACYTKDPAVLEVSLSEFEEDHLPNTGHPDAREQECWELLEGITGRFRSLLREGKPLGGNDCSARVLVNLLAQLAGCASQVRPGSDAKDRAYQAPAEKPSSGACQSPQQGRTCQWGDVLGTGALGPR